jgi:DNA mismatch endonuclease (patch repair protein)
MSKIRAKNTKPEILVRQYLYSKGFRYRIHGKLPGKPDIVFGKKKLAVFVHGCFWHRHGCHLTYTPKSNQEFWQKKFQNNIDRDMKVKDLLSELGWDMHELWECLLKQNFQHEMQALESRLTVENRLNS